MAQGGAKPLVPLVLPAIALGGIAAAGVADSTIRSDGTIAAFDATVPVTQAFADAAAVGSVAFAARRDHRHGMPTITLANLPAVPSCRVYHNTTQAAADSTVLFLVFNSERWDTNSMHDLVTNTGRLTAQTAGQYIITAQMEFAANAIGYRSLQIYLNGTTSIAAQVMPAVTAGGTTLVSTAALWNMVVGDYVQMLVYQNSGSSLNISASTGREAEFAMTRVGA